MFLLEIATFVRVNMLVFFVTSFEESKERETIEDDNKALEKQDVSMDEEPPATPKTISSWAALFKSNCEAPISKGPPVVSINYPETTGKVAMPNPNKVESNQPSSIIQVENDHNALALAGILFCIILNCCMVRCS